MYLCLHAFMCACLSAWVLSCVHACVRACVRARACVCVRESVRACVCGEREREREREGERVRACVHMQSVCTRVYACALNINISDVVADCTCSARGTEHPRLLRGAAVQEYERSRHQRPSPHSPRRHQE